jgi:hypothetical protein
MYKIFFKKDRQQFYNHQCPYRMLRFVYFKEFKKNIHLMQCS